MSLDNLRPFFFSCLSHAPLPHPEEPHICFEWLVSIYVVIIYNRLWLHTDSEIQLIFISTAFSHSPGFYCFSVKQMQPLD